MRLKDLLQDIDYEILQGNADVEIGSIAYDSRQVGGDTLFICIKGFKVDGHNYAFDSIKRGAVALIVQKEVKDIPRDITVIKVSNTRKAMSYIGAAFYKYPTNNIQLIGVTGTNGKTTTTFLIGKILEEHNYKVGIIGTIENRIGERAVEAERTTPESLDLQSLFSQMNSFHF